jgi:sugar phosphate permease
MLLVGRLLDRYGARVMLTVVTVLFGLAALWMSTVDNRLQLYLGFAAIRILGQGSLSLIPSTMVAIWFVRLRGRATAFSSLGIVLSQAVFPPLIFFLITRYGWRGAWVALAFIIWGVLLLPAILLARRSPESVGLKPDIGRGPASAATGAVISVQAPTGDWKLSEAMGTKAFWLLLFASTAQSLIGTALIFHQVSLFSSKGLSAGTAAAVLSVMAPAALLGTFLAGYTTDKLQNRFLISAGQVVLLAVMLSTFLIAVPGVAFIYGAALGFGGGFLITIGAVIWPNYYGRTYVGSIRGVAAATSVAAAALGPLPFGFLFDLTGTYTTAILAFLVLPASCSVAAFMAVPPKKPQVETAP